MAILVGCAVVKGPCRVSRNDVECAPGGEVTVVGPAGAVKAGTPQVDVDARIQVPPKERN